MSGAADAAGATGRGGADRRPQRGDLGLLEEEAHRVLRGEEEERTTQDAACAGDVLRIACLALAWGLSVKEISIPRLLISGFAFFFSGRRIVFFRFFFLPGTLIFLVMNLKLYWRRSCLARAPKPAAPPSAQASWVCTLCGPSLREPSRRFLLLRS